MAGAEVKVGEIIDRETAGRAILVEGFGEAEVQHFHFAIARDLDVRRLEIAMDDPPVVRRFQGYCNLQRRRDGFVQRDRTAREPVLERLAVDQLEDEYGQPRRRVALFDAVDCRDMWMVQRGEQTRLALEPRQPFWIGQEQRAAESEATSRCSRRSRAR